MTRSIRHGPLAHGWGWLQNLPGCCAACNDWSAQRICSACTSRFARLAPRCRLCAARVVERVGICGACLQSPPALDGAWAAVDYAFPWTQLVAQFKFRQGLDLATSLTELMARSGPPADVAPRLILPVPLSASRMRSRGYNQAWELARRLGEKLSWPARHDVLLKTRDTPEQMALPRHRRHANVHQAFSIAPRVGQTLAGERVVLLDDVMTTGATANEIARLLKGAGARSVEAWVFARTPSPFIAT